MPATGSPQDVMLDPDPNGPDFQTVLSLLDIYRPILEEDLKRASERSARAMWAATVEDAEPM